VEFSEGGEPEREGAGGDLSSPLSVCVCVCRRGPTTEQNAPIGERIKELLSFADGGCVNSALQSVLLARRPVLAITGL
jgi:hypothetical protein